MNTDNKKLAERIVKESLSFNGKFYNAHKKNLYFLIYVSNVKYTIRANEREEFLQQIATAKNETNANLTKIQHATETKTFGTGCVTTANKAHKYGYDAIEN